MEYQKIIRFWFEQITPKQWWIKDHEFDRLLKDKFLELHQQAIAGELYQWRETALGRLAEIIVLDQFSRNIFRDTPQAFSADPQALTLAQMAVSVGDDIKLSSQQRQFLYMPYMHSESLIIHQEAAKLYAQLEKGFGYDFELKHKVIIERFGRYPHRNKILGRESTPEELVFLTQAGSSF